jgi:serine/threonine-protein kinase
VEADLPVQAGPPPAIPGYNLLEKIGEGGMGQVYRAVQLNLQRTVAVKILHAPRGGSAQTTFLRECRLMASVAHPNIVTIYDSGEVDGRPYLVMEHVPAPSLRAHLSPGRPWSIPAALSLLDGVARALTSMHQHGILHLDLKPENILVGHRLSAVGDRPETDSRQPIAVKITDFGLALGDLDAGALADRFSALGSMDYCAPEQWHGLQRDQRSDLFSLATLAYELLTGKLPGRVFVPATRRNPELPATIDPVLRRGLARDPDERYATVEEFRQALHSALGTSPDREGGEQSGYIQRQNRSLTVAASEAGRLS